MAETEEVLLLVEDDPTDAQLFVAAAEQAGFDRPVMVAEDIPSAIGMLRAALDEGSWAPIGVMVDLGLPGASGHEMLRYLQADERTAEVTAIVLSGSDDAEHMDYAYELGATAFFRKPADLDGYLSMFEQLIRLWFPKRTTGVRQATRDDYSRWAEHIKNKNR